LAFVLLAVSAAAVWWYFGAAAPPSPLEAGLAAVERGDIASARECLADLRYSPGNEAQVHLLRGAILLKKGYAYPALDELRSVPGASEELKVRALTLTGEAWYRLGRHVEAQTVLRDVVEFDPSAADAHRWLAASYYDQGANHDAIRHLERTAQLDPSDQRPLRLLGLIYKDYERYEDAVPQYEESLRRKSDQLDWADVRQELAACQIKLHRYREALATLQPCPDSPSALVLRAECQHALGDSAAAETALDRALAVEPENVEALVLRGTMLLEDGRPQEAVGVLERATRAHPQDYASHFKLAQAYAQAGQPERAAAEQKIADRIREVRKVFADLHQTAWDNPEDARIRLRLAQLAKELGRPDLELVWLKAAAALQPLPNATPPSE
jgi:tetratricopeptide (TPR) repeat protein